MSNSRSYTGRILMTIMLSLLFVMASLAFPEPVNAEGGLETVTIGSGTSEVYEVPYSSDWNNSRTQIIYSAEEIGCDGYITSIAYNVAVPDAAYKVKSMKLWMGYADYDYFDYDKMRMVKDSEQSFDEDDLQLVYSGAPELGASAGWEPIELDTPFEYRRAQGNLVIVAGVKTSGGSNTLKYSCTMLGEGGNHLDRSRIASLYSGDQTDPSIAELSYSGTDSWKYRSVLPNIKLEIDTSTGGEVASCDVSFDTDGGEPVPETQVISRGGKATQPEDPVREGYRFTGWYKGNSKYNFDSAVNTSFTLKAGWIRVYSIRFVNWDDTELQSLVVDEGGKPEYEGDTPVRTDVDTDWVFAGWDPAIREADSDETYKAVFVDRADLADKTELNELIKTATDARTGVRTSANGQDVGKNFEYVSEEQWQTYDQALRDAQAVADDPLAKQDAVDSAVSDLEAALDKFLASKKPGLREPPAITDIVISKNSGRQQPATGGSYEWKVTFTEGTDLTAGIITDDDFQIQRKPYGQDWKNSKCPYVSFSPSELESEKNIGYLTGMAIPDNSKPTDKTNLWRFIYSGDSVDCPEIVQDGYLNVDKTELKNAIQDAQDAQVDVNVSEDGWDVSPSELFVTPSEKQALDSAIEAAQAADSNDRSTQAQVDKAASDLRSAIETFVKTKKGGNGADEEAGDLQGDYRLIYETEKVSLPDIPVREYNAGTDGNDASYDWFEGDQLRFEFYDSTTQQNAGVFTTQKGTYKGEDNETHQTQILSGVKLIRGHRYIVSVYEKDYTIPAYYTVTISDDGAGGSDSYTANMGNYYIRVNEDGKLPTDIKKKAELKYLDVMKRGSQTVDAADAKRVNIRIPVYYTEDGTSSTIHYLVAEAIIKLTSPAETLYVTSNENGEISASLIEDMNYMVELIDDSGALGLDMFPLTVKDHAENGWPKSIYNHFSCGSVQGIYLVDKKYEHSHDTRLRSPSGKTTVTGKNFLNSNESNTDRYFINDRQLDNNTVNGLSGKDYEVFRVDAVNMFRNELSRLAAGGFTITREIPKGRTVENVCYVNKQGKLKVLKFTQADGKVTFKMTTLSMYPNVIIYKSASGSSSATASESEKSTKAAKVKTVTVNTAVVSAKTIDKAVKKKGGSAKYVTKIVLGKKVRKISPKAFAKYKKVATLEVKTKKLTKKTVKKSLKSSKIKTIKVKVAKKAKTNKKYVKKYKKIFTKKNAGKKVKVKR